jgi:hypothetical protein
MGKQLLITFIVLSGIIWGTIGFVINNTPPNYVVAQKVTPTSNWKSYSDINFPISISYPSNYQVWPNGGEPEAPGGSPLIVAQFIPPDYAMEYSTEIVLAIIQKDWLSIDNLFSSFQTNTKALIDIKRIKVSGLDAVQLTTGGNPNQFIGTDVYFIKDDMTYRISFTGPTDDPNYPTFEQMLSTIRFTDKLTSDWKTYTNNYYGFEFLYPSNFSVDASSNGDTVRIIRNDKRSSADSNIYITGDALKGLTLKHLAESMSEQTFVGDYKIREEIFAGREAEIKYNGTYQNMVISNPLESQPGYLRIDLDIGDSDSAPILRTFKFTN